ncbi:MAG: DUF4911 domain-containing protein [Desulfobulbaceae bacterium]|nr:DUF4911 domain-containing protein [Desulfobulbaceae bacterium]
MQKINSDDALITLYLHINREQIGYLRHIMEGYDGLAILSTIDATKGMVKVILPRSRYSEFIPLLEAISPDLIEPNLQLVN